MANDDATIDDSLDASRRERGAGVERLALVLVWSRDEPERVGEVALVGPRRGPWILGRETDDNLDEPGRLSWLRQRPGDSEATGQLRSPRISRAHLELRARGLESLELRNLSRRPMWVNGVESTEARLSPGDVLELHKVAMFWCTRRPERMPARPNLDLEHHEFGGPDRGGIVGESPAIWELRERLAFAAQRQAHALVRGPSGSGKELAAALIHEHSDRAEGPFVARNAATLPAGLIDAELFGNARNYPNPGMDARPGLVGAADGGTLFLDELGELPHELQAHLLRLLDRGEYQRLGEAQARRAALRFVGATNRDLGELKHDLLARMPIRVELPGLELRREDVPLLVVHLLRGIALRDPGIAARFFVDGDPEGWPRIHRALIAELLTRAYTTHVRELQERLYASMLASTGEVLEPAEPARTPSAEPEPAAVEPEATVDPASLTPAQIQACLDAHGGSQAKTWRALGLRSRYQLARLLRKHGIAQKL